MTLHVHPLSPSNPHDHKYLRSIAWIHLQAWLTVPLMKTIYYGPPESYPGVVAANLERHSKAFVEDFDKPGETCRFAVVVDDELSEDEGEAETEGQKPKGKLIAAIKYYLIDPTASTTNSASSSSSRTWPPYSNVLLATDFWSHLVRSRTQLASLLGRHVLVDNLYTDPGHHRRGAGGMLMQHAVDEADRLGWPSMLEASPKGVGVYEKVGFRRIRAGGEGEGEIWVDLKRWQDGGDRGVDFSERRLKDDGGRGEGWYCQVIMVRPAKGSNVDAVEASNVSEMGKGEAAVV